MFVRTALPRTGSLEASTRPAAYVVAAGGEQLAPGTAGQPVVEGELQPGGPGERPGREAALLQLLGLRPARGPDLADDGEPRGADACAPTPAPRRAGCGRRRGSPRAAAPGSAGSSCSPAREARVDEVRGPVDLAVVQRQLEAAGEGAEQVRSHADGDHRVVALLADVAGAELGQGRLRRRVVVDAAGSGGASTPPGRPGVSSAYIAAMSPRSQASTKRCAAGASGSTATTIPPANASVATTISGAARVAMRRRRSAVAPPVLNPPRSARGR